MSRAELSLGSDGAIRRVIQSSPDPPASCSSFRNSGLCRWGFGFFARCRRPAFLFLLLLELISDIGRERLGHDVRLHLF